ncbi:MAG: SDR family oxidoreductase [Epulopiscium sp.]|nr:SDR family oxidoreductase [Candidatus Epulonipiscium sp.]
MIALITGATSGIGRDMAVILSRQGYDLILASRNTAKMKQLQKRLKTSVEIVTVDLSKEEDCRRLYDTVKEKEIDLLINNAGFGVFGKFHETSLEKELNMIDLNIRAVHMLTKLFLQDFRKRNRGTILNVSSSASFFPGPLLASYYATKAYVLRLSLAIYEELRREGSNVQISVLCPGPVDTGFNERANVRFSLKGMNSRKVAAYALKKMQEGKLVIIPGFTMQAAYYGRRVIPLKLLLKGTYHMQKKKEG